MSIRVLMVTDAEGSYTETGERFGLTELVKALEKNGLCSVKKAHRYPSGWVHTEGADITHFQFTNSAHFNPDNYDEVWLMGFGSSNPAGPYGDPADYKMTPAEVEKLAAFMNDGGGVFATGDHDDLGKDLCGDVPRVRSMRLWEADYSGSGTTDLSKSPRPFGADRLDTLQKGHDNFFEFQDQSDDVPQRIYPVMRTLRSHVTHVAGGVFGWAEKVPHPLLCGPDGVINVLPDHMHEGRCVVPENLSGTFSIGGSSKAEYPTNSIGVQIAPEEVAFGVTTPRSHDPAFSDPDFRDSNTPVNYADFADIVAYNGHRAGVGRVVVGATFHHYVNINVTGVKSAFTSEPDPENPINSKGFLASPAGQKHYEHIQTYWQNVARWIARRHKWFDLAWVAFKNVAFDPRLKQIVPMGRYDRVSADSIVSYGAYAFDLLRESYATCTVLSFIIDIAIPDPLSYLLSHEAYIRLTLPDPSPIERVRAGLQNDKLEVAYHALGAAMLELRQPETYKAYLSGKLDAKRGLEIVHHAAQKGALRGLENQAERMENTVKAIRETISLAAQQHNNDKPARKAS